jgi:glycosyltransferase involved in cell wall biosynthesis
MAMRKKNSILFVRPDYHCSFFYRDEFRKKGWKADIFVNNRYPGELLYSKDDILVSPKIYGGHQKLFSVFNHLSLIIWWLSKFWKYEYHVYYGRPPAVGFLENKIGFTKLFGNDFLIELWLAKRFGVKLIFLPTGCHDDESKAEFQKLDSGNVCNNCGAWNKCFDELNNLNFSRIRRYFNMQIGVGAICSTQFRMTHLKWKSIDLELWSPNLQIPPEYKVPATNKIRILHSAYLEKSGRSWRGRNIKGSPFVLEAIQRLQEEGYPVEYFYIKDKPSNQMRFYQAQADIVVEQLIYGWWGSTFVETSALGKPVVCYLRKSWKDCFFKTFPEYKQLPIIEADTSTIYDALKQLVVDVDYRKRKGKESRQFAERHFDPQKNTLSFIQHLESL